MENSRKKELSKVLFFISLMRSQDTIRLAIYVGNKTCETIADAIMGKWISVFGAPRGFVCDNGGEMTGTEMRDLCAHLNIKLSSTPAKAAWCNGISERNHATVDNILLSLMRDFPNHDRNLRLS